MATAGSILSLTNTAQQNKYGTLLPHVPKQMCMTFYNFGQATWQSWPSKIR